MKRSFMIMALMLICFGIKAIAAGPDVCYVKTADKVYFGTDVKKGVLHTKIISADGTITKVETKDIKSFMHDGKRYDLLALICPTGDTLCYNFLEYVSTKSGLTLYRYECCENLRDHVLVYFVYKNDKLYLRVNQYNAESVLPFFGIKHISVI